MIEREGSVELDSSTDHVPAVPHERLVVSVPVDGMLKLPAIATEVFEAGQVPETIMLIGYQHWMTKFSLQLQSTFRDALNKIVKFGDFVLN